MCHSTTCGAGERLLAHRQTYRREGRQRVHAAAILEDVPARLQQEGRDQQRQSCDACSAAWLQCHQSVFEQLLRITM